LDDSADDLVIGLGSTLGTTSHIVIDEAGCVTKPLQPAFFVRPSSTQSDLGTGGTTIAWGAEIYDVNADFASNTFTAPVTGKYHFSIGVTIAELSTACTLMEITTVTSNRSVRGNKITPNSMIDGDAQNYISLHVSFDIDMDASDTATVRVEVTNGGGSQDLIGDAGDSGPITWWSGHLIC